MNRKKDWIFLISFFVLLNPLNLEAKVNLSNMNLLENIQTQSTEDELTIKFNFKKSLKHFNQPIFYEKSIQIDFPFAYSQPAKKFITTGNSQISQIYVSQFDAQKMRVRLIFGKDANGEYDNRVRLQKEDDSLTIRIGLKQVDLLDQLLARATAKIEEQRREQLTNTAKADVEKEKVIEEPIRFEVKKAVLRDSEKSTEGWAGKIKTASFNQKPDWKGDKKKPADSARSAIKASFSFLKPDSKKDSKPISLATSGFKMVMTLSLVLGLIFLLFFGFKKFVLKNTAFGGGGKLIRVLNTSFLAPKKNITMVEVAGEILVLGISDQNISLLTTIREPGRIEEIKNSQGNNSGSTDGSQGFQGKVAGKVSWATSNAANAFSKYLKDFSGPESNKNSSVAAVTEKIRRHLGKVRTA